MIARARHESPTQDSPKEAAIIALKRLLEPLALLMLDTGVAIPEFNKAAREVAVRVAAKRVERETGRESKSKIAIATGLSRSEVTKILTSLSATTIQESNPHPVGRVLDAWFDDPRFLTSNGSPAVLPIFGKKRSFQRLVEEHGVGLPVRAMLDELTRIDALERLPDQMVRPKTRFPVTSRLSTELIGAVGERGGDMLEALMKGLSEGLPLYEATASLRCLDADAIFAIRRELSERGERFMRGVGLLVNQYQSKRGRTVTESKNCRLTVTAFYSEEDLSAVAGSSSNNSQSRRKNLRRR